MAVLNPFLREVRSLIGELERSQWYHRPDFGLVRGPQVLTREQLRNVEIPAGVPTSTTTGSTGEQLVVAKTREDAVWHLATNIRGMAWSNWDYKKSLAVVNPKTQTGDRPSWGLPRELIPRQGPGYFHKMDYLEVLQEWIEEKNPHYILAYPSIVQQLDLSRVSNFIDARGTGENGGSTYSSEECGTIAIRCPENSQVYHVMENILVETDEDGSAIISSLTNPYIRRYKIGDHLELGSCGCGRTLQAIKKIHGRTRNMVVFPDGRKRWPMTGSIHFFTKFGIRRYQMVQTDVHTIEFSIVSARLSATAAADLISFVRGNLGYDFNIVLKYVEGFPPGKFEEFKSLCGGAFRKGNPEPLTSSKIS